MSTIPEDVRADENGVWRVATSRVSLDSVVIAYWEGQSAETIQQQFPALSLADVYGAIAFYLRHRDEVDQYLKQQAIVWETARTECNSKSGALIQRLREARAGAKVETK